jgi:hypothetical protein
MTGKLLTYLILILLTSSCGKNLLTYKHRMHYREDNIIDSVNNSKLCQSVGYNRPGVVDEEFYYELRITFLDSAAAKTKRVLDLEKDSSIVHVTYGIFSVWSWEAEKNTVKGQIEIKNWDPSGITLKENIVATNFTRKETKKYKGTRTFKRKKGWGVW